MVEPRENIMAILRQAAEKYPDVPNALKWARPRIVGLPEFEEQVSDIITHCLREWLYDIRHEANSKMRKDAAHSQMKTNLGESKSVQEVAEQLFAYRIAGTLLGLVMGEDLPGIVESESAKAEGHSFNARLATLLMPMVPKGKAVEQVISGRKLWEIFQKAERKGKAA